MPRAPLALSDPGWRRGFAAGHEGLCHCCRAVQRQMPQCGRVRIGNLAAVHGLAVIPPSSPAG
jgi:NAD(P)-dependent dehydrogenase (short-subunit alcohol dehydrogenase family)